MATSPLVARGQHIIISVSQYVLKLIIIWIRKVVSVPIMMSTVEYVYIYTHYIWLKSNLYLGNITKTCLYYFDHLKPHFYIVKLGFTGVYIIFLISAQNIDCGYSLEPPRRGGSNEYPQSMF